MKPSFVIATNLISILLGVLIGTSLSRSPDGATEAQATDPPGPVSSIRASESRAGSINNPRSDDFNREKFVSLLTRFKEEPSRETMESLQSALRKATPDQLEELALENLPNAGMDPAAQFVVFQGMRELAAVDPERALKFFETEEAARIARFGFSDVAVAVARDNPLVLVDWLAGLPADNPSSQPLFEYGVGSIAQLEPAMAVQVLSESGRSSNLAISSVFPSFGAKDPEAALAAAHRTFSGHQLEVAISGIAFGRSRSDPEAALITLATLPPTEYLVRQRQTILDNWEVRDPDSAAAYRRKAEEQAPHVEQ